MLRTSKKLGSNLGGWVVPAHLFRALWPEEVGRGHDLFQEHDGRWRRQARQLRARTPRPSATAQSGFSIGKIIADVAPVITGGDINSIHIEHHPADRPHRGPGTR
jgi:hypothetical protein